MNKNTTLYINNKNLNKIDDAAGKTQRKINFIIIKLLEFAVRDNKKLQNNRTSVEYQKSSPSCIWSRFHVTFPEDIAVFCMDMRRFYCKSASLILAYSVDKYLEKLLNKLLGIDSEKNTSDNYQLDNINFIREFHKDGLCWIRKWKLPPKT